MDFNKKSCYQVLVAEKQTNRVVHQAYIQYEDEAKCYARDMAITFGAECRIEVYRPYEGLY